MKTRTIKRFAFNIPALVVGATPVLIIVALIHILSPAPARAQTTDECLACHGEKTFEENGRKLFIDPEAFANSTHGKNAVECIMCHQDLSGVKDFPHKPDLQPVNCAACHGDQDAKYVLSIHGKSRKAGNMDAPSCTDCHGSHYILPKTDTNSKISPFNIPKMCDNCHSNPEIIKRNNLPDLNFIQNYDTGVHGVALRAKGLVSAATCVSCHGAHGILKADNPESSVNRKEIPKTCGKCHTGIFQQYVLSVHGLDYLKGIKDVPVCTDCHGEHNILSPDNPKSTVFTATVGLTCSKCHDNVELERRFNLPPDRLSSYQSTYHGIASRGGNLKVANCASCHGVHNILPSSNPASLINPKNLPATCGKPECHGKNLENVIKGKVHITEARQDNVWMYIVTNVYKVMIVVIVGSFLLFIGVDLHARRRKKRARMAAAAKRENGNKADNG